MYGPSRQFAEQYRKLGVTSAVMEADPHRLVALLLGGACERIRLAEACLARGDLARKGKAIGVVTVAGEIVDGDAGPGTAGGDRVAKLLDEALVLWLPGPNTETGEDMAELHLHGGRAIIAAVQHELAHLPGFRLAEPGEFTRRAFEAGRMDLTAVEGLGDLIFAETEAQRAQAMRQFQGLLGQRAESWRQRLIGALALVEARPSDHVVRRRPGRLGRRSAVVLGRADTEV